MDAIGNRTKDYYPWAKKVNPQYITANTQDANYNPLLASQRTRGELMNQISDPTTARYNMSYQPDLVSGFLQETQRNDSMNRQEQSRVNGYNTQMYNQSEAQNAQIDTDLYNKNTQTLVNRDSENRLRKNNIFHVLNNAVNNRTKETMLQMMYPQFRFDQVSGAPVFTQGLPDGSASPTQSQAPMTDEYRNFMIYKNLSPEEREMWDRLNKIDTTRRTVRTKE